MLQMMKGNNALIAGTLAQDPDFVELGAGKIPAVRFSILAVRGARDGSTPSTFCRCTAWRDLREALRGCKKGDSVFCLATVQEREYNGQTYKDYTAEYVSAAVKEASMVAMEREVPSGMPAGTQVVDDDLPF